MATVKGDVHDIGKNIVAVVLRCNGYEVIDLGVMVPCDTILQTAEDERVDVVGLSGLITPSLEEMVLVASEMERRGIGLPLLIGGATTSRQHTAVKIAPVFDGSVTHVSDASRVADVMASLLNPVQRETFVTANKKDQSILREQYTARRERKIRSYEEAKRLCVEVDWSTIQIPVPAFTGRREITVELDTLVPLIDWTYFFSAWQLKGRYPAILDDPDRGTAARELYNHATGLLSTITNEGLLKATGVYGFWPAASDGDDIIVYVPEDSSKPGTGTEQLRFNMLRQQDIGDGKVSRSLADFIAPIHSQKIDYIGAFALTTGAGVDQLVERYERDHDDYKAIMVKALADRLAEAFAEYLHFRVRDEWGYGDSEELSREALLAEEYRGIRPAFGYPACPDHSEKFKLFDLLNVESVGISLTESASMIPAASVSGLYFSSPDARYFTVGRIGSDQITEYASRKGFTVQEVERWLASNLAYEPER